MKDIRIILLVVILMILVFFVGYRGICALEQRDIPHWGRYVFTVPGLDIVVGGLDAISMSKNKAGLFNDETNFEWLRLREGVEGINFYNMDWDDLICDLSQMDAIKIKSGDSFRIPDADSYLVFSTKSMFVQIKGWDEMLKIAPKRMGNKWAFLEKVYLREGKYTAYGTDGGEILLIPKKKYKLWYRKVKNFIFKNDIVVQYLFKDRKTGYINIFRSNVEGNVKMKITPTLKRAELINKETIIGAEELMRCGYYPNMVDRYKAEIDEDGNLNIDVIFDGDLTEDEYIRMLLEDNKIDIDLKKNPYLGIRYKVEDPQIQTIQLVLGIDFDEDKNADIFFRNIHTLDDIGLWTEYIYPVYQTLTEQFPGKGYMHVVFMEIYPHKRWGADRRGDKDGMYSFWIKDLYFFNKSEPEDSFLLDTIAIDDLDSSTWDVHVVKGELVADNKGLMVNIFEGINVNLYKDIPRIDLSEFPLLMLDFTADNIKQLEKVNLIIGLDFNNDDVLDSELVINEDDIMFGPLNVLEIAKRVFPQNKFYKILKVNIKFILNAPFRYGNINLNRFAIFRRDEVRRDSIVFNGTMFRLDDKSYENKDFTRTGLEFEANVNLAKGRHVIMDILFDEYFKSAGFMFETGNEHADRGDIPKVVGVRRLNPTLYRVGVDEGDRDFWLIFNEYFHNGWSAYLIQYNNDLEDIDKHYSWSTTLYTLRVKNRLKRLTSHWFVNNCANGWWINKQKDGRMDILLVFEPQKKYELALLATGISILGCIAGIWRLRHYR